jgi:hypothetical protein
VSLPPLFLCRCTYAYCLSLIGSIWCLCLWVLVDGGIETRFCLPFRLFFSVTPRAVWNQFLDIPSGTRDLTRHLEDLTWRYPVEPVERASLWLCEALAQWRGKPELEKVSPHLTRPPDRWFPSPNQNELSFLPRSSHPIPPLPLLSVFSFHHALSLEFFELTFFFLLGHIVQEAVAYAKPPYNCLPTRGTRRRRHSTRDRAILRHSRQDDDYNDYDSDGGYTRSCGCPGLR